MAQTAEQFTAEEIAQAQADLDFHPDASPYWDQAGQDSLYIARRAGLKASNTNRERCRLYAQQARLDEFQGVVEEASRETALAYLEAEEFDVQGAIESYRADHERRYV